MSLLALGLLAGCFEPVGEPSISYYPFSIDLGVIRPEGGRNPTVDFSVVNENRYRVTMAKLDIRGEAGQYLEVIDSVKVDIDSRAAATSRIGLKEREPLPKRAWTSGEFEGEMDVKVSGFSRLDELTGDPDPESAFEILETIDVRMTVDCDYDRDGFDRAICGGVDCDDDIFGVNPDAEEVCNGIDDNCNGEVDEGCFEDLDD